MRYDEVLDSLRRAYDGKAAWRDTREKEPFKLAERDAFLARLQANGQGNGQTNSQANGSGRLLEIGAGTGQDSAFFARSGLEVVAVDLSAEMVARCRAKGIDAKVADFLNLGFPAESFDAVYTMNSLLHVPSADLTAVFAAIRQVLRPGGLFYAGMWAGGGAQGQLDNDDHDPPRYFCWRTDAELREAAATWFEIVQFDVLRPGKYPFQSLTARRPRHFP